MRKLLIAMIGFFAVAVALASAAPASKTAKKPEPVRPDLEQIKAEGYTLLDDHICSMPFWANGEKYFTIQGPNGEKIEFVQIL